MRLAIFCLFAVLFCVQSQSVAASYNYERDTVSISDTTDTNTVRYGRALNLSGYSDIRWIFKVSDTSTAGFKDDSVRYLVGYQTGSVVFNSSGKIDTAWSERRVVLDSLHDDSLGVIGTALGSAAESGTLTAARSAFDTLSVSGYAVKSVWFVPEWDMLIRPWARTRTGRNGQNNVFIVESLRRVGTKVVP